MYVAVASTGYLLEIENSLQSEEEYATMVSFYIIDRYYYLMYIYYIN